MTTTHTLPPLIYDTPTNTPQNTLPTYPLTHPFAPRLHFHFHTFCYSPSPSLSLSRHPSHCVTYEPWTLLFHTLLLPPISPMHCGVRVYLCLLCVMVLCCGIVVFLGGAGLDYNPMDAQGFIRINAVRLRANNMLAKRKWVHKAWPSQIERDWWNSSSSSRGWLVSHCCGVCCRGRSSIGVVAMESSINKTASHQSSI